MRAVHPWLVLRYAHADSAKAEKYDPNTDHRVVPVLTKNYKIISKAKSLHTDSCCALAPPVHARQIPLKFGGVPSQAHSHKPGRFGTMFAKSANRIYAHSASHATTIF